MKKTVFKVSLFLSAFTPLYILIAINIILEIINDNLHFNVLNTTMLCLMVIFIIVGFVGISVLLNKKNSSKQIKPITFNNITDQHFLGYFSLFVLFALSLDLSKISYAVVFLIILILIGIVYIKNGMYYVNPLLNIIGYSFYDITYLDMESGKTSKTRVFCKGLIESNTEYKITQKSEHMVIISK